MELGSNSDSGDLPLLLETSQGPLLAFSPKAPHPGILSKPVSI